MYLRNISTDIIKCIYKAFMQSPVPDIRDISKASEPGSPALEETPIMAGQNMRGEIEIDQLPLWSQQKYCQHSHRRMIHERI